MGCVYLARNKVNGKGYIGKTVFALKCRRKGHEAEAKVSPKLPFHRALVKYGFSNFSWRILFRSSVNEDLLAEEVKLIREMDTKDPSGYNLTDGGDGATGYTHTEEAKKKIGQAVTKRGSPTADTRKKLSKVLKGNKRFFGHRHSDDAREKNRQAAIKFWASEDGMKTKEKLRQTGLEYWRRRRGKDI